MKNVAHQYEDKLLEFAYGELAAPDAAAVEAHVRTCAKCTQALNEIRAVRATMAQLPIEAAPDAGLESLLAYAEQAAARNATTQAPSKPTWFKRLVAPLATVLALSTVGVVALRANRELDLSPAQVAAQKTAERHEESSSYARNEPEAPVSATPAPAAPEAEAVAEKALEGFGGTGVVERKAKENKLSKRDLAKSVALDTPPAPPSGGKGAGGGLSDLAQGDGARSSKSLREDYSNSRGGYVATKESKDVASPDLADDKAPAPGQVQRAAPMVDAEAALGSSAQQGPAPAVQKPAPAPARARGEAPADAPSEAVAQAPAPRKSYTLSPLARSSDRVMEDEAMKAPRPKAEADDQALMTEQRRQFSQDSLEAMRLAASRGDRTAEINAARKALDTGAQGSARAEALMHLCNAYDALGQGAAAGPWCDQLQREFPNSAAAAAVAARRSSAGSATPASAAPMPTKKARAAESEPTSAQ